jgi:DNA-binding transcriptional MerR regulator
MTIAECSKSLNIPSTTLRYWIKTKKIQSQSEIRDGESVTVVDDDEVKTYATSKVSYKVDDDEDVISETTTSTSLVQVEFLKELKPVYDRLIDAERHAAVQETENMFLKEDLRVAKERISELESENVTLMKRYEHLLQNTINLGFIKIRRQNI